MPSGGNSQIVSQGFAPVAPNTQDTIPFIVEDNPAGLSATILKRATGDGAIYTGASDPHAGASEGVRLGSGLISEGAGNDSVVLGRGAAAAATDAIAIGRGASADNGGSSLAIGATAAAANTNAVAIGEGASASSDTSGLGSTAVGAFAASLKQASAFGRSASAGAFSTAVGYNASAQRDGGFFGCVAVGTAAVTTFRACTAIGYAARATAGGSIAIGTDVQANAANCIIIAADSGENQSSISSAGTGSIVIGGANTITHSKNIVLGKGFTSIGANYLVLGTPDNAVNTVLLGSGDTAGAGAGGVTIRMTNATGTDIAAGTLTIQAPRSTGSAAPGEILFQVASAGGSGTTLQTLTDALRIGAGGVVRFYQRPRFDATTAAGTDALTLGNGPAGTAGAPDAYISVNVNGTNAVIPAWYV